MPDVLVVDGDRGVRLSLTRALVTAGFQVREADDGLAALDAVTAYPPSGVVLDAATTGLDGVSVVRRIRTLGHTRPVCVLGRNGAVSEILAAGADDYAAKPVAADDLAARLQALVRLHEVSDDRPVLAGDLTIEPARRLACRRGRDLELTTREFDLLRVLARHCGRVLSRAELLERVWGYTWAVDDRVVDVFVAALRGKLEAAGEPRILTSVRNAGFVLNP